MEETPSPLPIGALLAYALVHGDAVIAYVAAALCLMDGLPRFARALRTAFT